MKMIKLALVLLAIVLTACGAPATPTATPTPSANISAILTVTAPQGSGNSKTTPASGAGTPVPPGTTLVVAHRGGAALAPENTLGAFENAIKLGGVDMVECDVHLSKDGEVVVMHDPDVSRTTDGKGQIGTLTLAEIKQLNAAAKFGDKKWSPQAVPTLAELLDLVKGKIGIQIEIKVTAAGARYAGIERKVIDLLNARGMLDKTLIISFDFPTLKEIKTLEPRLKTGALVQANWFSSRSNADQAVADAITATGADYFLPTAGPVSEAVVQATHARGIKLGVWTVDAASDMRRYAGWGVDAITTNSPDELKRALGR